MIHIYVLYAAAILTIVAATYEGYRKPFMAMPLPVTVIVVGVGYAMLGTLLNLLGALVI